MSRSGIVTGPDALLLWLQRQTAGYKGVKIKDFTSSFSNGLALCALVHRYRPDLIPYDQLKTDTKEDHLHNVVLAFKAAEQLGVDQLMDAEDIVAGGERLSNITQLSEFYEKLRKLKPQAVTAGGSAGEASGGVAAEDESAEQLTVSGGLLSVDDPRRQKLEELRRQERHGKKFCAFCGEPASGQCVEIEGNEYHIACFKCTTCHKKIVSRTQCITVNGFPYCELCGKQAWIRNRHVTKESKDTETTPSTPKDIPLSTKISEAEEDIDAKIRRELEEEDRKAREDLERRKREWEEERKRREKEEEELIRKEVEAEMLLEFLEKRKRERQIKESEAITETSTIVSSQSETPSIKDVNTTATIPSSLSAPLNSLSEEEKMRIREAIRRVKSGRLPDKMKEKEDIEGEANTSVTEVVTDEEREEIKRISSGTYQHQQVIQEVQTKQQGPETEEEEYQHQRDEARRKRLEERKKREEKERQEEEEYQRQREEIRKKREEERRLQEEKERQEEEERQRKHQEERKKREDERRKQEEEERIEEERRRRREEVHKRRREELERVLRGEEKRKQPESADKKRDEEAQREREKRREIIRKKLLLRHLELCTTSPSATPPTNRANSSIENVFERRRREREERRRREIEEVARLLSVLTFNLQP
jgi:hypothetical protein